ncbi:helix-turn-helix domain-containing protein [Ralstonia sp. 25C]|uniref:helix-turn-helix domain-containing protein n=1 Tax=Ralstonia sp. 25C TaxID=3447363 RepID=UPI003F74C2F1
MTARIQNTVLLDATGTAGRHYLPQFPSAGQRPHTPGDAPLTMVTRPPSTTSISVVLMDTTQLVGFADDGALGKPMTIEQAHAVLGRMLDAYRDAPAAKPRKSSVLSMLTRRQCEILHEAASGKSNVEIAQTLHISVETVKSHVREILMRLQARNRTELAALYQQCNSEARG